jgi:hypothetical protein
MTSSPDDEGRTYVYAIAEAGSVSTDGLTGVAEADATVVREAGLDAIVSPVGDATVRPRRKNLEAHHDLLKAVTETGTVLPMAFGVVASSPEQVRAFLDEHGDRLARQLDHVRDHVEVGLRIEWNVDDIFSYFVERYDELEELRDAFFGESGSASRQEMIQLGERFEEILEAEREAHRQTVEDHVADVCADLTVDDPSDETDVVDMALLVARDRVDALEEVILEAAEDFDDEFLFTYTDPMAPYSFVEVDFQK